MKKGKNLFCAFLALLLFALVPLHVAKAEEIGEWDFKRVVKRFRWIHKNSIGNVVTYVSGDLLGSQHQSFKNQLTQAASNWTNNRSLAACFVKSFDDCNVCFSNTSDRYWEILNPPPGTIAITVPRDTNGLDVVTLQDMERSNGQIRYAAIYFNPTPPTGITGNSTYCLQTMVHEIGHVYGMGHVSPEKSVTSIMKPTISTQTTLTTYDVSVLDSFYR